MNFFDMLLNFFYPKKCGICNKISKSYICENCKRKIDKIKCVKIKKIRNNYNHLYIFKYKGIIRQKIIEYKFRDKAYLYKFFSDIILTNKKICNVLKKYDMIIPVPIHRQRRIKRGYNQTELIAKEIAKNIDNLDYCKNCLIKIKNIKAQSTLNSFERQQNTVGAYKVINENIIKNKKVIIFDDVYTTGSTAKECCNILKKYNVKEILIFTISKD